ncbi:MAG: ribosome biogenesis GTPase YlqF [Oscillospiraceae bacterium]|nr:ribosome biogenesis GTPase YlqF [Oscillospiraceae bacterium]
MNIQWYPGHMTKTRRQIEADLKQVDAVCEIVDARIPASSRNPDIDAICGNKPRIVILNRMDLADPNATARWAAYFRSRNMAAVATDCKTKRGISEFQPAVRGLLREKLERDAAKGMRRPIRVMVVGIPNVGKSTLINQISGRKGAKAENRPGVTRGKQWVAVDPSLLLLDTPGILWPKFDDPNVGLMLAYTGAVKESVIDLEELAARLMELLWKRYPQAVKERYGIDMQPDTPGYQLLEEAGRKRGYLLSRGEINTERMAKVLIDEFRSAKLGRFTLEEPEKTV